MKQRTVTIDRNTNETQIKLSLNIDGTGKRNIKIPLGFLFNSLEHFARHGLFDLDIKADGDVFIDDHHLTEDIGIVLGKAFAEAIGEKRGINRFGYFILAREEVLATAAVDLSGRYAFRFDCLFQRERVGDLSTEMVRHFWDAFAQNAKINLHVKTENSKNDHHQIEAIFMVIAKALRMACKIDERMKDQIPSTKGSL